MIINSFGILHYNFITTIIVHEYVGIPYILFEDLLKSYNFNFVLITK